VYHRTDLALRSESGVRVSWGIVMFIRFTEGQAARRFLPRPCEICLRGKNPLPRFLARLHER
jgi:hypothetical protein